MHYSKATLATLLTAIAASLSGCATAYDPKTLTAVPTSSSLALHDAFRYEWELGGICTMRVQFTLAPGTYVSKVQNDSGVFFRGPDRALESNMVYSTCNGATVGRGLKIDADIFVPKNAQEPPRIFIHQPQNGAYDITLTALQGGSEDAGVNQVSMQAAMATPHLTPVAGGVGAGLGAGIVTAIIVADYGKIKIAPGQKDDALKRALALR